MKYQVGDYVKVNNKDGAGSSIVGKTFRVTETDSYEYHGYRLEGRHEGFCEKELDLVRKKGTVNTRRTFRLLKDTPELEKGALVQEACDDGDQNYILLDFEQMSDATYGDWTDYFSGNFALSRDTVEQQPEWFEEVEMTWLPKTVRAIKKVTKKGKK